MDTLPYALRSLPIAPCERAADQDEEPVRLAAVRMSETDVKFLLRDGADMNLPESILLHAQALAEGGVLSPKEFLHIGSRAAIDQAFSRLTKEGKLLRITRGTYVAPIPCRSGARPPSPDKVVKSIAEQSGERVASHGASDANLLGLTKQAPAEEVFLTSGRSKKLKFGRSEVLLKHAPQWMLALGSTPAGAAIRALAWMGPAHANKALVALRRTLPPPEWHALTSSRAILPSWLAQAIGNESVRG